MSYFDSAYIAKFYVDEPQSDAVRHLAETLVRVHCCALGRVEVAGVFHRKWREGAFSEREFREVSAQFSDDCAAGLWTWLSVTDRVVANAAESLRILSKRITIRSADALHLVCARDNGLLRIYTNDRHMLHAAPDFGVEAMGI
ncbi:MAG TPA: type II toxin-antitoxin system VapC family toxin [Burkholderiales bacterium]|nr:type II toxin-antitoxin system VapC family toxin [Burkholderiales bacterium]